MAKIKKEVVAEANGTAAADVTVKEEDTYAEKVKNVNQIASPLASKKLTKKCYKLIKKGKRQNLKSIYFVILLFIYYHRVFRHTKVYQLFNFEVRFNCVCTLIYLF